MSPDLPEESPVAPDESSGRLRKPHEMIVMVPHGHRFNLMSRRIYNVLVQLTQTRLKELGTMPPANYHFAAPLGTILRLTGTVSDQRARAKTYLREMRRVEVDWESTSTDGGVIWTNLSLLSEARIELRHGENWVFWAFPPTLMNKIAEPERWAVMDLELLTKLGTYCALALYEICVRYKTSPSGLTGRKPPQWWLNALSQSTSGEREWRKFKSERVKDAIEEINLNTDIEVELLEHKEGRAVTEVQFAVRRKHVEPRRVAKAEPVDVSLVTRAEAAGISESRLESLFREFGEETVRQHLQRLEQRIAEPLASRIHNAYAYLRTLLREERERHPPTPNAQDMRPTPAAATPGPHQAVSRAALASSNVPAPQRSHYEALHPPGAEEVLKRMEELKAEILRLDPATRSALVDRAMEDLQQKGLLSPTVRRRALQGDVMHGVVGATILRLYGEQSLGANWTGRPTAEVPSS